MASAADEDQVRELVAKMQAYQARMEALQQQANLVQVSIDDVDNALKALTVLDGIEPGHDMLVPIGAGSFVHATIMKPDRVLVGLGAGVTVEKTATDAKTVVQSRRTDLEKVLVETTNALNEITGELMRLQQEAEKYRH